VVRLTERADVEPSSRSFTDLTTLRVGGAPAVALSCRSETAVAEVVGALDAEDVPLLVVGGGSNLVVGEGVPALVAVVLEGGDGPQAGGQLEIDRETGVVRAFAGLVWDDVVAATVDAGLGGLECLSGIPGSVGATPVQNVGAYGAEVSQTLRRVQLFDRTTGETSWVAPEALDLAYRYSNLKFTSRAVVTAVEFQLTTDGLSAPLRFGELARRLGVGADEAGGGDDVRRPVREVREMVLELRRGKGMVLDPEDHDTWSAGSFFTNPVVDSAVADEVQRTVGAMRGEQDAAGMPRFAAGGADDGREKLSAAWLIERAGFTRGWHVPGNDRASLSTKHTLALTNRGSATSSDIVGLARAVRDGVRDTFGVTLVPEPVWVGVTLDPG
jgi:UDP-N-acetylmuramate dehydrogenase